MMIEIKHKELPRLKAIQQSWTNTQNSGLVHCYIISVLELPWVPDSKMSHSSKTKYRAPGYRCHRCALFLCSGTRWYGNT
jgi:hypothetical protein